MNEKEFHAILGRHVLAHHGMPGLAAVFLERVDTYLPTCQPMPDLRLTSST